MPISSNSVCKKCRRAGEKLFLRGDRCFSTKCAMVKRNYPPGQHGPKGYKRLSGYGQQLKHKQTAKKIYGLMEKQMRKYFAESFKLKGNTAEMLSQMIERRLDNVIYCLGYAKSRRLARQLVSHGHFKVNNVNVNIPSYLVKPGEVISIKDSAKKTKYFTALETAIQTKENKAEMPGWLSFDPKKMEGKVIAKPTLNDSKQAINWQAIVEFYSR